jgi:hypothetical protein
MACSSGFYFVGLVSGIAYSGENFISMITATHF